MLKEDGSAFCKSCFSDGKYFIEIGFNISKYALSLIVYIITDAGIEEQHKQVFKVNEIELIIAD